MITVVSHDPDPQDDVDNALYILGTVTTSDFELIREQRDVAVFDLEDAVRTARDLLLNAREGSKSSATIILNGILDYVDSSNNANEWETYFKRRVRLAFLSKRCTVATLSRSGLTLANAAIGIVRRWPSLVDPRLSAPRQQRPSTVFTALTFLSCAIMPDWPSPRQALEVARVRRTLRRRDISRSVGRIAGSVLNIYGYPWWYQMDHHSSFELSLLAALLCP